MNEFEYKYKCGCNDKIHSMTWGAQEDTITKSKIDIEKIACPICETKIKLNKIIQIVEDDKLVEKEIGIRG